MAATTKNMPSRSPGSNARWRHSTVFDWAQERTCGVASGATTRTRALASRRLAILDSATAPAPTTRQDRAESLRNKGKSFSNFIRTVDALLAEVWATNADQNVAFIVLRSSLRRGEFGFRRDDRESGERSFRVRGDSNRAG